MCILRKCVTCIMCVNVCCIEPIERNTTKFGSVSLVGLEKYIKLNMQFNVLSDGRDEMTILRLLPIKVISENSYYYFRIILF